MPLYETAYTLWLTSSIRSATSTVAVGICIRSNDSLKRLPSNICTRQMPVNNTEQSDSTHDRAKHHISSIYVPSLHNNAWIVDHQCNAVVYLSSCTYGICLRTHIGQIKTKCKLCTAGELPRCTRATTIITRRCNRTTNFAVSTCSNLDQLHYKITCRVARVRTYTNSIRLIQLLRR